MSEFAGLILAMILALGVGMGIARAMRERLRAASKTPGRRQALGAFLLVVEAIVALLLSSIDFGVAIKGASFTPEDTPLLPWLVGLAGLGAGLQMMVLIHGDYAENERAALEKEAALARKDRDFVMRLSSVINRAVARKREKLLTLQRGDDVLAALEPKHAIAVLIQQSWHVFDEMGQAERASNFRLRVAYYRAGADGLTLAHSWNGSDLNCVPMTDEVRKRFLFSHPQNCMAVAASKSGDMLLVGDTVVAHDDRKHPFWFFEEPDERDTLKSIAALPIKLDGTKSPYSILVVDTNERNFFNPSDQRQVLELEQVVVNLAQRLQLEERLGYLTGGAS